LGNKVEHNQHVGFSSGKTYAYLTPHTPKYSRPIVGANRAEALEACQESPALSFENLGYERLSPIASESNSSASYEMMGPGDIELDYIVPDDRHIEPDAPYESIEQ